MKAPKRTSTKKKHDRIRAMFEKLTAKKTDKGRSIMNTDAAVEQVADHFCVSEKHVMRILKQQD